MPRDDELLRRWAEGDQVAGEALADRHMATLYRFFRTKIPEEAEDLVQETFLSALEKREPPQGNFRAYLLAIARNRLYRRFRTLVRADKKHALAALSVNDVVPTPGGLFAARSELGLLLRALRTIPTDFQIVIELYYWEQLSTADIAAVIDVAPGTVKSRLARARDALKDAIRAQEADAALHESTSDRLEHWAARLKEQILPDDSA